MSSQRTNVGSGLASDRKRDIIHSIDGWVCVYCQCEVARQSAIDAGAQLSLATLDHVVAHASGGTDLPSNLITACRSCNSARQDRSVRGFMAYLRAKGVVTVGIEARINALLPEHKYLDTMDRMPAKRGEKE